MTLYSLECADVSFRIYSLSLSLGRESGRITGAATGQDGLKESSAS